MKKRSLPVFALILTLTLITLAALSAGAGGDTAEEEESIVLRHLHALGEKLHELHASGHHGSGHHGSEHNHQMEHVARLIAQLNLSEAQYQHIEKIHELLEAHPGGLHGSMNALHERLMGEIDGGYADAGRVQRVIDHHLEELRTLAYGITDEFTALINGLDAEQREILVAHLEKAKRHSDG